MDEKQDGKEDTATHEIDSEVKLIPFPRREEQTMATKTKGRYANQSLALTAEEKEGLEVLHVWSGYKPATLARALYYRGIAAFLKDGKLKPPQGEETLAVELDTYIDSSPELKQARQIVRARTAREGPQVMKARKAK